MNTSAAAMCNWQTEAENNMDWQMRARNWRDDGSIDVINNQVHTNEEHTSMFNASLMFVYSFGRRSNASQFLFLLHRLLLKWQCRK